MAPAYVPQGKKNLVLFFLIPYFSYLKVRVWLLLLFLKVIYMIDFFLQIFNYGGQQGMEAPYVPQGRKLQ